MLKVSFTCLHLHSHLLLRDLALWQTMKLRKLSRFIKTCRRQQTIKHVVDVFRSETKVTTSMYVDRFHFGDWVVDITFVNNDDCLLNRRVIRN